MPALGQFLGSTKGLSAATITKMTQAWQAEQRAFSGRDLSNVDYVYLWADGIHVNIRLEETKLCLLVMIGVRADGRKELIALTDGYREATESWADLLRDCKRRGMRAPVLAAGDGALGFWGALSSWRVAWSLSKSVVVTAAASSYKGHRYPGEIIAHCVWLYHRFPLSFREVEELMLARGVVVSYETIRAWCAKFGQAYANQLRRRRAQPGDRWHLDEVFIRINGTIHYLWRAVDQHGDVLDILVQSRRNAKAAKKFFRKLLKGLRYVPRVLVTDKLRSYGVAHREVMPSVQHRQSKYLNNRAENSHQPTRQRERAMKRFTSPGHAQRFLSAFSGISPHFRPRRHLLSATGWRHEMADRFTVWGTSGFSVGGYRYV